MVDLDTVTKVVGVLGFIISVLTFCLTRYERRSNCVVEIVVSDLASYSAEFSSDDDLIEETLKIRVTNIGGQPVILKPESFYFSALDKTISQFQNRIDWFGIGQLLSPLNPGTSCDVGVITDSILEELGFKSLDQYCNQTEFARTEVPIEVGVSDLRGRVYKSKGFTYFYYVNSLERST
ncbi:TPA: hypothetical protein O4G69_004419 [Vibrio alginolyticus]|uniref:hypothetical protein n=1 Tax=Vibrio alginolyticus TaxID=663 RepID=UPI001BD6855D|nr:hypothetical protein [Vibrio alginolyticus]EKZ8663561.1 hypothetical protein [Vibrio alginolyticus]MBS9995637.1 hypothetical protein [Vibrio alginolyticus]HCZ9267823.1 hypothetical protein [Vibrio alginolyticus]